MPGNSNSSFQSTFEYKLIYVFRINDEAHGGSLKVGDATIHTTKTFDQLPPNCSELNAAARKRIDEYTVTAGIVYQLLYTEVAVYRVNKPGDEFDGLIQAFRDYHVHRVLKRSGIKSKYFDPDKRQNEWFKTDLETVKKAIQAVKDNRRALTASEVSQGRDPIVFRPEQLQAISDTINRFKTATKMLWNAKMRFGKTLTALQVAKQKGFSKTIIITHRPVVKDSWFKDFEKIFYDSPDFAFGSKDKGMPIDQLIASGKKFVYFVSMQDLGGSAEVGGNFEKNKEIFDLRWDFVVVDEAHEGTQTQLGKAVLKKIIKDGGEQPTYVLNLSGTPFNLLTDFEEQSIYTWDYIKEQEAKMNWAKTHFGDSNPYEELPKMNIFTYHLEEVLKAYLDLEDKAFNFREFFRVWTGDVQRDGGRIPAGAAIGSFVHESDIESFLDLVCKKDSKTQYPFSTDEYRSFFRHTLWIVPGVKEAKALSGLLKHHHIFQHFKIVNVAGEGDEEIDTSDALTAVRDAMTKHPEDTYTITISCGRLTTGVSVPEWTAVLMLAGTYATAASQYLQTIFRVQTPANINGRIKENCYVFDFAPDRTLKMVAEAVQLSTRAGSRNVAAEMALGQFLNFCPVIAIDESGMKEFKVAYLLQQLKKAYADRVVKNGFDDTRLYNDELLRLDDVELEDFERLKAIIGASKPTGRIDDIIITDTGLTDEEHEPVDQPADNPPKKKKELTEEEKKALEELRRKRKQRLGAISILRSISIRIPLLIYGIDKDIDEDITIEAFSRPDIIDDLSWDEFMPKGVTRDIFRKFSKYYDKDIFIAAGRRIRAIARSADELEPTERVAKIASLFATFKNPDKETVLTPWRIVNLHMSLTLGGYDFFNESHSEPLDEPRLVPITGVTEKVFTKESNILEINSKTGLYPLYVAYSLYRAHCEDISAEDLTDQKKREIWDDVVAKHVFVVCKTPMAKLITRRTLIGYRDAKVNTKYFQDLVNQLADERKRQNFLRKVRQGKAYWKATEDNHMKFNAIVGNPPYHEETAKHRSETNGQSRGKSIFHYFQVAADAITEGYTSLIYPGVRWMHRSGKGMAQFGKYQMNDVHLQKIDFFPEAQDIFADVAIADGITIVLKNKMKKNGGFEYVYHENGVATSVHLDNPGDQLIPLNPRNASIVEKVTKFVDDHQLSFIFERVLSQKLFGIESSFVQDNPGLVRELTSESVIDYATEIKLLANDKAGKAGRARWYITKRSVITERPDLIDEFQVVVSSANAGGQKRDSQLSIIDNHSAFGRSRVALGTFKTEEEAKRFYNYCKSSLIRFMFLMTDEQLTSLGKKVPDIGDYGPNAIIDLNGDIDAQLKTQIGLSDDEMQYVYDVIGHIDLKRGLNKSGGEEE